MFIVENLSKTFTDGPDKVMAVDRVSLSLPNKGLIFVIGRSGSGKTTLVSLLSGLLKPTEGKIILDGQELGKTLCAKKIAVLFQEHNLIEDMTCVQNLSLVSKNEGEITEGLNKLGMRDKVTQKVSTLSGGEKKRLSILRCLLSKASILVLDEPTANLDANNAKEVFDLLKDISKTKLVISVSHDKENAQKYGDFLYEMEKGRIKPLQEQSLSGREKTDEEDSSPRENKMGPRFFLSFAQKTIWKHPGKTVGTTFLSCFSFALAMLLSSLSFFQLDSSLANVFKESGATFIPLVSHRSTNLASEGIEDAQNLFPDFLSVLSVREKKSDLSLQAFPYKPGMTINGQVVEEPQSGSCVVSSLVSTLTDNSISLDWGETENRSFSVASSIDTGDLSQILNWYQNCKDESGRISSSSEFYRFSQDSSYLQNYGFVILNSEDFQGAFKCSSSKALSASDFLLSYIYDDSIYASKDVSYASYSNQQISEGRSPNQEGEVIISEQYLKQASNGLDSDDPSSVIGKTYHYRDLSNCSIKVPTRLDLLFSSITIVGVTADSNASVYMYPSSFEKIIYEITCSSLELYSLNKNPSSLAAILKQHKEDYTTQLSGTSASYFLESTKSSPIFPYIIAATILLLILSLIFIMMLSDENVRDRKREIALLESLGISKKSIQGCFLFQNGVTTLASFLIAMVLVYPSLIIVNAVLKSPSVFGVPYNVLVISPWSILIGLACCIAAALLSTVLPLARISKIEILKALKED